MEHIKLVCFSDKCLILNPDHKATENFINGLKMQLQSKVSKSCHRQKRRISLNIYPTPISCEVPADQFEALRPSLPPTPSTPQYGTINIDTLFVKQTLTLGKICDARSYTRRQTLTIRRMPRCSTRNAQWESLYRIVFRYIDIKYNYQMTSTSWWTLIHWKEFGQKYDENLLRQDLAFEHVILENALEKVVRKFRRHLQIIKPALEMLLQQIEQVWKESSHIVIWDFSEPRDKWSEASFGR